MSTSGTPTVQYTRDDLIKAAMRKLGVLAKGQTPDTEDLTNGTMALNTAVAEMRTHGMPLWARNEYTFNLTTSTFLYQIGTSRTLNTPYPLKIYQAYRLDNSSTNRIPVDVIANYDFNLLPVNSSGSPIQLTYQPYTNYGEIKLWPTPSSADAANTITIVYQRPFEYFLSATDTADFPEEWYLPLVYRLAILLAPEFGVPVTDRNQLREEYKDILERVLEFGGENASFYIQPAMRQ